MTRKPEIARHVRRVELAGGWRKEERERAGQRWRVATSEGSRFDADHVILATEAHATARLTRYLDPALAWVGVKDSGRGCTLSVVGYEHLTRPKSFHMRLKTS